MKVFMEELEASRNTITRDFEYLRDSLGAPLEYCRENNGHRYAPDAPVFELPGFWMSSAELYALLACGQLLDNVQPGLISSRLAPLKSKIRDLLGESGHDAQAIDDRIHIQPVQIRNANHQMFDLVAQATLSQKCVTFHYQPRGEGAGKHRIVHPQRLLHYRSNWYLLAYCEEVEALRLFSLDRISLACIADTPARPMSEHELETFANAGFGIFGGEPKATAHLCFTHHAARWVAEEQWHKKQKGELKENGYHLHVPYADERELVMEILRYGADVEVLGPQELREEVASRIRDMARIY